MHARHFLTLMATALALLTSPGTASANAPEPAAPATGLPAGQRLIGQAAFRWLGLEIYRATLHADAGFNPRFFDEHRFALELEYQRSFDGNAIAQRSIEEMESLAPLPAATVRDWLKAMRQVFPGVRPGDRLLGVHEPGAGARFFHNGRLVGQIDDPLFAAHFFAIWLSPRTSQPRLREALISGALR